MEMVKLCAATILLMCVVFVRIGGSVSLETPHELYVDWTFADQEGPDDLEEEGSVAESGSGAEPSVTSGDRHIEFDESENQWLARHRSGHIHVSRGKDIAELAEFVAARLRGASDGIAFVSHAPMQMEDGPTKLVDESDKRPRTSPQGEFYNTALPPPQEAQVDEIEGTNFYPEYGVGILEGGCTAFLVGPRFALTTASCVYNYSDGLWKDGLDFWRGRNGDEYLEKMLWDHAIIPAKFFITGDHVYNWALIVFSEEFESPVWLKMASTSEVSDVTTTMYGYLHDHHPWGKMYSTVCQSDPVQDDAHCLTLHCETSQKFSGGPILKGYNFQHSKMPLVYGISIAYDDSSNVHKAVKFHPSLFWSLCHHMAREGFDVKCGIQRL